MLRDASESLQRDHELWSQQRCGHNVESEHEHTVCTNVLSSRTCSCSCSGQEWKIYGIDRFGRSDEDLGFENVQNDGRILYDNTGIES